MNIPEFVLIGVGMARFPGKLAFSNLNDEISANPPSAILK
jgi:hypothetical protein